MAKYNVLKEYIQENVNKMKLLFPNNTEKELKEFIENEINNSFKNHDAVLDNNYIHKTAKSTMLDILQYIYETKPIIAGYGVLFKDNDKAINPAVAMLDKFGDDRKALKKELKKATPGTYLYNKLDRAQKRKKINMNSYYGSSGNESSVFYNRYTAAATTLTGQSLISAAETGFEMFLTNNVKWYDMDDFLLFVSRVVNEDYKFNLKCGHVSDKRIFDKLIGTFHNKVNVNTSMVQTVINNLSYEDKLKIYYKNNLMEFFEIPTIHSLLKTIVNSLVEFKDPYGVPDTIVDDLNKFWNLCKKYVMYDYPVYNRVNRLRYEKRENVVTIDTDSNMVTVNRWKEYILNNIFDKSSQAKSDDDKKFIAVNIFASILTKLVNDHVIMTYCEYANILPRLRPRLNLKNEIYYLRLVLTSTKKRYVGLIRLREGKEIYPELIDVKGLDYSKSTASDYTKDFFNNLVKEHILYEKNINGAIIINELRKFRETIIASLKNGEKTFLTPTAVKEVEAYKNPLSIQAVIGTLIWNFIYPESAISPPDKVYILKLSLVRDKDLDDLQMRYPDIWEKIFDNIINSKYKELKKRKVDIIAIPQNVDKIPDWCIPYINTTEIVNDNLSKFYPILESLGINTLETRANELYYSNIIF